MELEEWMVGEEILEGVPPHLYTNDSDQQGLHTWQICSGLVGLQDFCKDDLLQCIANQSSYDDMLSGNFGSFL